MTTPASPLHSDDAAASYPVSGPDGSPAMQIVGHRFTDPAGFDAWAGLVRQLSAHPNIATIFQAGSGSDGRPSMVVDAGGSTLSERLCHTGPLAVGEGVTNASLLALALDTLHQNGLRHGAVSPSTVLFNGFGHPQLAGLDGQAPGMAPPSAVSRFNPLDPVPGPASDVYALAATSYLALGGQLPFAVDPHNPALRNQSILDLPGVPQQVTGLLRAALNPDPNGRPSAAQLHAELATIELPHVPTAAPALPAEAVGIAIRPVTTGVVEINRAGGTPRPVSGAPAPFPTSGAPAPYPTSGAPMYPTSGGPAAFPVTGPPAPQYAPQFAPQQPWAPQPVPQKKSSVGIVLGVSALALAVVVTVVIVAVNAGKKDDPTPDPVIAVDEGIKQVDLDNADVSLLQEPGTLSNGESGLYSLSGEPVYADVDGDNDLDAAAVIENAGDSAEDLDAWEFVQVWLYEPSSKRAEPLYFEATWQWTCSELPTLSLDVDAALPNHFEVTRADANWCDDGFHSSEQIHVEVKDGEVVQYDDGHYSAVVNCRDDVNSTGLETKDVYGLSDPLFHPDSSSKVVAQDSEFTKMVVYYAKDTSTDINNGYAYGVISFTDGTLGCGWVPWDVVV
ncbi:serine/threonine protein kinase [Phytomonospora endophytica]|uniref:non-specific serine/threonine protein kinase n=1 Tax=Phytomonospora endophytica TaxID=714109 RepID=A0A841FRR1_9ACTN|nr:hypothetical protein [Phytomonospora endophytica]MBB6035239.1 hypothetical protein [Phytomonospora endophytica]